MFYSQSTGGFYITEIHGKNIPSDSVEITLEHHEILMSGQSNGFQIVSDESGFPDLGPKPEYDAFILPITPRQIRQALTAAGLRESVESGVAAGSQDLKDWWEFSDSFERMHPEVIAFGIALKKSDKELDALWALGASL